MADRESKTRLDARKEWPYWLAGIVAVGTALAITVAGQLAMGWIVPLFVLVVAVILAVVWASSGGLGNLLTVGLGLGSIAVALLWLFSAERRGQLSPLVRALMWIAVVVSIVIVLAAVRTAMGTS